MKGIIRSVGIAVAASFAIPVSVISGFISAVVLLVLIFSSSARSFELFMVCIGSGGISYLALRFLRGIAEQGAKKIADINQKESLKLNPANMLGYPSPAFMAFDKENRRLAICNSVTGDYQLYDFNYVLQWYYEWGTGIRSRMNADGELGRMGSFTETEYKKNFTIVLEVANENRPFLKFPVMGETAAKRWCATLSAIFNG